MFSAQYTVRVGVAPTRPPRETEIRWVTFAIDFDDDVSSEVQDVIAMQEAVRIVGESGNSMHRVPTMVTSTKIESMVI